MYLLKSLKRLFRSPGTSPIKKRRTSDDDLLSIPLPLLPVDKAVVRDFALYEDLHEEFLFTFVKDGHVHQLYQDVRIYSSSLPLSLASLSFLLFNCWGLCPPELVSLLVCSRERSKSQSGSVRVYVSYEDYKIEQLEVLILVFTNGLLSEVDLFDLVDSNQLVDFLNLIDDDLSVKIPFLNSFHDILSDGFSMSKEKLCSILKFLPSIAEQESFTRLETEDLDDGFLVSLHSLHHIKKCSGCYFLTVDGTIVDVHGSDYFPNFDLKIQDFYLSESVFILLTVSGVVYTHGISHHGMLGLGSCTKSLAPTAVDLPITVEKIHCDGWAVLALGQGRLFGWGWNAYGQLGIGHYDEIENVSLLCSIRTPREVLVEITKRGRKPSVVDIFCGKEASVIKLSDGSFLTSGNFTNKKSRVFTTLIIKRTEEFIKLFE
ncbi:hypothetical protein GEMRC1_009072 [Eukaryota sp. GEM-RC1]